MKSQQSVMMSRLNQTFIKSQVKLLPGFGMVITNMCVEPTGKVILTAIRCPSNLQKCEREKQRVYTQRVREAEHASFIPPIMDCWQGCIYLLQKFN